jgi:hypothetical protein
MEREPTGTYTMQTQLSMSLHDRQALERMVRDRHVDPSYLISGLIADTAPRPPAPDAEQARTARVPVHIYLSAAQREAVQRCAVEHKLPVSAVLSEMVACALREHGEPAGQIADAPRPEAQRPRVSPAELERLRQRRLAYGDAVPGWLEAYITQLEAEIERDS